MIIINYFIVEEDFVCCRARRGDALPWLLVADDGRLSVSLSAFLVSDAARQAQGKNDADQLEKKKKNIKKSNFVIDKIVIGIYDAFST